MREITFMRTLAGTTYFKNAQVGIGKFPKDAQKLY